MYLLTLCLTRAQRVPFGEIGANSIVLRMVALWRPKQQTDPITVEAVTTPAPKYRRMSAEQRRDHLVASALALFSRFPHHQVLPEQVAAEAGVSRALFYHYFAGMDEVYLAALKVATDDLVARLLPPARTAAEHQIHHVITELFAFGEQYRTPYIAMHSRHAAATPESYAEVEKARNGLVEHTIRWAGLDVPTPLLTLTMRSWTAVLEGAVLSWLTQESLDRARWKPGSTVNSSRC